MKCVPAVIQLRHKLHIERHCGFLSSNGTESSWQNYAKKTYDRKLIVEAHINSPAEVQAAFDRANANGQASLFLSAEESTVNFINSRYSGRIYVSHGAVLSMRVDSTLPFIRLIPSSILRYF